MKLKGGTPKKVCLPGLRPPCGIQDLQRRMLHAWHKRLRLTLPMVI